MADSERALGRLDRALELVHGDDAKRLPRAAQIELRIVESASDAIRVLPTGRARARCSRADRRKAAPVVRQALLRYGDALLAAGRTEAAREAFSRLSSPTETNRPMPWPASTNWTASPSPTWKTTKTTTKQMRTSSPSTTR